MKHSPFALFPLVVLAACSEGPLPPNILLVTVDTLRADHLGSYGYGRDTSPRIDALAERSTRFERAYTQWPKTGPAIASLMTSTCGSTSGVMRSTGRIPVPSEYETPAELLRKRGWWTRCRV